jgi:hypothetical protein
MNSNVNLVKVIDSSTTASREAIRALLHELQNHLHSATMIAELARLGVAEGADSIKLLQILDLIKHSLQALRICVLPSEEVTCEDPMALLNTALAEVDKKLRAGKIRVRLDHRGPMPRVELNKECARNAFERLLSHCCRRLRAGGDLQIVTGAKLLNGRQFAEIALTLVPSAFKVYGNHVCCNCTADSDGIDADMVVALEVLKRYGARVSLERNGKKPVRLTLLLNAARVSK